MKQLTVAILTMISGLALGQHNSVYSQYMFNGLLINPAYAGSQEALNVTGLYRAQWVGLEGAPTTITFSAHTPLRNKKINIGLIAMQDQLGISQHSKASLVYAYRFRLSKGFFSLGISGGVDAYRTNWNDIRTTQASDPTFVPGPQRTIAPQAGAGMYYYSKRFYIGLSAPTLLNSMKFDEYQPAVLSTGVLLKVSDNFRIKPVVLFKYMLHSPYEIDLASTFYWKDVIGLGVNYRLNDALTAFLDLRINEQFRLGYGYDYSVSKLQNYSNGSHEIMLRYLFRYKVNPQSARYF